ncbi:MAG: DUF488 domain-containing protein [Acidobacteria bacterium]|nr:DUF488 domain-containing protein [Acidobacteriota bacterium]
MATIYTIGHSTRSLQELIEALQAHAIGVLADIRAFPMSSRLPWFNRESLERELPRAGIAYIWIPALGGRRKKQMERSPNLGLRNNSFRNYADYMLSRSFRAGIAEVLELATRNIAIMCAERVYFHCHRMLVADWLAAHGHTVLHMDAGGPARAHRLTAEAVLQGDDVVYPESSSSIK